MKSQVLDFTRIIKKYKGKWVALTKDEKRVISFSKSARKTLEAAKKDRYENLILFKAPITILPCVGGNLVWIHR